MLMEYGSFVLPDQVPANEFLNLEGQKFSTSRGWAVWTHEFLEAFDADLLRYVLAGIMPENKDADFSWKDFQNRVNTELADILGNFLFRTQTFVHKYFDGKVPASSKLQPVDEAALEAILTQVQKVSDAYERFAFKEAVTQSMQLARIGNKYLTDTEPWKTRKSDPVKCANSVYVAVQIAAALSQIFDPIMPQKMEELRKALHLEKSSNWKTVAKESISAGSALEEPTILFSKIEDEPILKQLDLLQSKIQRHFDESLEMEEEKPFKPLSESIEFDDFIKLDLRVAEVVQAEKMKKSNKMLKLSLDMGFEHRTVLSGIAKFYSPEELIGKKVVLVANLKPRKMMGVESQGMVLMAEDREEQLFFVSSDAENGSPIS